MIYVLTYCIFMSSSGESCNDMATYKTLDACISDAESYEKENKTKHVYRCEGRKIEGK